MDSKSTLKTPLLGEDKYVSGAKAADADAAVYIHQSYARVAPKILLEVMTARALMLVLAITYLTFALAFLFDVRSTILGYRNNNREASALSCDRYNITTAHEAILINSEFGCTFNSTSAEPVWFGQFTDLDNIISMSLELEIKNISSALLNDIGSGRFKYDTRLYGCYDSSACSDWIEVLAMNDEYIDFEDSYDSKDEVLRIALIGNTFQNQEALPTKGVVKSYIAIVRYAVEGVDSVPNLVDFTYKFETINKQSNQAADALTVIMQLLTIAFTVWYCRILFTASAQSDILPEQHWVIFYLFALILFQNPVYCVICWVREPSAVAVFSYYIIDSLSQTVFYVIWLLFADSLRRNRGKAMFYGPKLFFGVVIFAANVVILTYQFPTLSPIIDRNPLLAVYNWSGDTKRVLVGFSVLFLFLLWFWTIWWFFRLHSTGMALKQMRYMDTRYLQLSFRFFTLQATLVTLYYVVQYFVVIYFVLSRSSDGWVNDLNSVADTINTLFRQQTQSFGKICFLTVYGIVLAVFFIPVGWMSLEKHPALEATYVVRESEINPLRKHRKKLIRAMGKFGSALVKATAEVLCLEIGLEMMELSYEAYYDPTGQHTESGFGIMNLERLGYLMLDSKYYAELDTVCYICRNTSRNHVVVVFRGTSSKKHWSLNLDYGKIEIDIEKDYKMPHLDKVDGLDVETFNFNINDEESDTSSVSEEDIADHENEKRSTLTGLLESTMSKAGAGMTRAASFVGAASSNAYDVTLGATADVMLRTAHHTPILKNALACSVHRGFWTAYSSVREFIHEVLRRELSVNPANVYFTGHSLGMCLSLAAAEVFSVDVEIICVRWGYGDVRRLGLFYTFSKPYKQFFAIGPLAV